MINKYTYLLPVVLIAAIFIASCGKVANPCLTPKTIVLKVGMYLPADTGAAGKAYNLPKAVIGLVDTPVIFYSAAEASKFDLILNPSVDSVRWFIRPDSAIFADQDTITFYYERKLEFLSTACSYTYFYNLLDVKTSGLLIDSVKVTEKEVNTNVNVEHVKIFF